MAQSKAKTVKEYLDSLPLERRKDIEAVRKVILKNLPKGYKENMNWGMIVYEIPLSRYPDTYNNQPIGLAALAVQKHYMALYLMNVYGSPEIEAWFKSEYKKSGKKLDMGKSCVRFKTLDDLPLKLIGKTIAKTPVEEYLKMYKAARKIPK